MAATWADKSFALVSEGGYLDKLAGIYPAPKLIPQSLSVTQLSTLKAALDQTDDCQLLKVLLALPRFPFNDPYVSFLRQNPADIASNPQTAKRICNRLRQMGIDNVVKGLEEPKQFNRQMGALFNNWLMKTYPHTSDTVTFQSSRSLIFLNVSGEKLRSFANQVGCGLQKRPDFLARAGNKYIVGEAKFIGTEGGNQNRGFDDAIKLASSSFKQAITVAVLDGIVWIPNSRQMSKRLANFGGYAMSALLLDEFLQSI